MSKIVRGKYKKGVVEPLEPVELAEEEVVEIIVPGKEATNDDAVFLSSFGTWKDLVPEDFIDEVYRERMRGSRSPIDL